MSSQSIHLYLTSEHACGYLPGRRATNLVPDPQRQMDMGLYGRLIELGYRRSGDYTYRPHCAECSQCQPCRIPVDQFIPRRNQKRCLDRNSDLSISIIPAGYHDEHFELYRSYINTRHADGDMINPTPEDFSNFLYSTWSNTHFIEMRKNGRLLAVAVTDFIDSGLSAVYSYFDAEETRRSLGTLCILQQLEQAKKMQLDYLYMGYWIEQCQKMSYKADFQPLEILVDHRWVLADATS